MNFSLNGARIIAQESKSITIVLQELQRVKALEQSGAKGGDGTTSVATIDATACAAHGYQPLSRRLRCTRCEAAITQCERLNVDM